MNKPNVCKQCGRSFSHRPIKNGMFTTSSWDGGDTDGFCSEGCLNAYNAAAKRDQLEYEKKKGKKVLEKWKKDIEKLEEALEGDDPRAIAKARRGSGAGCGKVGCLIILLAILGFIGYVWISVKMEEAGEASPSKPAAAEQTKVVDELPQLETNENTAPSEQLEQNVE